MKATVQVKNVKELENFLKNEAPNIYTLDELRDLYLDSDYYGYFDNYTYIFRNLNDLGRIKGGKHIPEIIADWDNPEQFENAPFTLEPADMDAPHYGDDVKYKPVPFTADVFRGVADLVARELWRDHTACPFLLTIEKIKG